MKSICVVRTVKSHAQHCRVVQVHWGTSVAFMMVVAGVERWAGTGCLWQVGGSLSLVERLPLELAKKIQETHI